MDWDETQNLTSTLNFTFTRLKMCFTIHSIQAKAYSVNGQAAVDETPDFCLTMSIHFQLAFLAILTIVTIEAKTRDYL
uniref:Uncharacterized protein n=1 Tax=Tetranychus urticae TaxID=32264 RepID=T1K1H8_TETUR